MLATISAEKSGVTTEVTTADGTTTYAYVYTFIVG